MPESRDDERDDRTGEPYAFPPGGYVSPWVAIAWRAFGAYTPPAHIVRHRTFDRGAQRCPHETDGSYANRQEQHRRFDVAEQELIGLLGSGCAKASGLKPARAVSGEKLHHPSRDRDDIPSRTFLNQNLAFEPAGALVVREPLLSRLFPSYELRGTDNDPGFPYYHDVLVSTEELREAWQVESGRTNNPADLAPADKPYWTASEALTWLAIGKPETWDEVKVRATIFYDRWRTQPPAEDVQHLLKARASRCPFYPWQPVILDVAASNAVSIAGWTSPFASPPRTVQGPHGMQRVPGAPELARAIRARHRREQGSLVAFSELVAMFEADLEEQRQLDLKLDAATVLLRKAIATGQVTALGVPASHPEQLPQALPAVVASWPIQFRNDAIEPGRDATPAEQTAIRQSARFIRVRFAAVEIRGLKQPTGQSASASAPVTSTPMNKSRKHTGLDYRKGDAHLVQRMKAMLDSGEARSRRDAALAVVGDATGKGKMESKVARLIKLYGSTFGDV